MGKLTTHQFVEIFNESKEAGQAEYTARGGKLPMRSVAQVRSVFTGMFCADRDTLLVEAKVEAMDDMCTVEIS